MLHSKKGISNDVMFIDLPIPGINNIPLSSVLIILAPALFYDFFWQYFVRIIFILPIRFIRYIKTTHYKKRIREFQNSIEDSKENITRLRSDFSGIEHLKDDKKNSRIKGLLISEINRQKHLNEALNRLLKPDFLPSVSIIVPCHNSGKVIEGTLNSLLKLSYDIKEIIVVDDASTDDTYKKAIKYSPPVRVFQRKTSTGRKTGAVNFGIAFSSGEVVVVVDDDTIIGKNSIQPLVQPMSDPKVAAVGANVRVIASKYNLLTTLQRIEYLSVMELGRQFQSYVYKSVFVISGAFGAFMRSYLERIGEYDIDIITEDLDITWKLYKLRKRVEYVPQAISWTDVPTKWRHLVKQRTRWDIGFFETLMKHYRFAFKRGFGAAGFLLLPEAMLEAIMLLLRPFYYFGLLVFGQKALPVFILTFYFYLILEVFLIFTSAIISENKRNVWLVFLALPMLLYRWFLGIVRWRALILHLFARKRHEW